MKRLVHMLVLILAGEMIFALPFHTARFFRPTLLDAFGFSNTQLGDVSPSTALPRCWPIFRAACWPTGSRRAN